MTRLSILSSATLLANTVPAGSDTKDAHGQKVSPDAVEVRTMSETASVQSIDQANRTVTLKTADGALHTYKCSPEVRNFDKMKVGDQVIATVTDELALFVHKSDMPANV